VGWVLPASAFASETAMVAQANSTATSGSWKPPAFSMR